MMVSYEVETKPKWNPSVHISTRVEKNYYPGENYLSPSGGWRLVRRNWEPESKKRTETVRCAVCECPVRRTTGPDPAREEQEYECKKKEEEDTFNAWWRRSVYGKASETPAKAGSRASGARSRAVPHHLYHHKHCQSEQAETAKAANNHGLICVDCPQPLRPWVRGRRPHYYSPMEVRFPLSQTWPRGEPVRTRKRLIVNRLNLADDVPASGGAGGTGAARARELRVLRKSLEVVLKKNNKSILWAERAPEE